MKLVDADIVQEVIYQYKAKKMKENKKGCLQYFKQEFELVEAVVKAIKEATAPELRIIQAKYDGWIPCEKELPETGANVILTFKDTFHTHESWPRVAVMPAWICNVDEENPKGMWAIEGRLGNYGIDIESGVAWMPMPEPYQKAD